MVHISEVANTFVNEIKDHIKEGENVKVKVLSIGDDGKISLSIKKAQDPPPSRPHPASRPANNNFNRNQSNNNFKPRDNQGGNKRPFDNNRSFDKKAAPADPSTAFEDMLNKFKQNSEEKMSDIKKNIEGKRKSTSRRGGPKM